MNVVILGGRLARDPELRTTSTGKKVCSFTVAVKRDKKDDTDFFKCKAWERTGENIAKFFTKGRYISITGAIENSKYTDKSGNERESTEINVSKFDFTDSKTETRPAQVKPETAVARGGYKQTDLDGFMDIQGFSEELPFT